MDFLGSMLPLVSQFNANQTARQNAREARDWEEEMYLKYNSPSALVRQYDEAVINPALMFGGSTPAAPTDTAAAETIQPQTGTVTEMLGQLINLDLLDAEKRKKQAEAADAEASAAGKNLSNEVNRQFAVLEKQYSIAEIIARINKYEEETKTTEYEREIIGPLRELLTKAQARGENAAAAIDEWKRYYMDKYGASPDVGFREQALESLLEWLNGKPKKEHGNNLPGGKDSPVTIPDYGVK